MSKCRVIKGLRSVERLPASPWPKAKLIGPAAQGKRYEKKIARALPNGVSNPWFRFLDDNGVGCCSPDILLSTPFGIAVIECKLTYTTDANDQLSSLYLPVIRKFYGVPTFGLIIVKNLGRGYYGPRAFSSLQTAIAARGVEYPVLLAPGLTPAHLKLQLALAP